MADARVVVIDARLWVRNPISIVDQFGDCLGGHECSVGVGL